MALRDTLEAMQASSRAPKMVLLVASLAVIAVIVAKFGRNPNTYADEKEPSVGASAADRFAAFAGRWT